MVSGEETLQDQSNSEYQHFGIESQSCGAKVVGREGNNPDSRLRPLNSS